MNKQRYLQIAALAAQAAQRLNRYGSVRRSLLPEVTLTEHHWLIAKAKHVAGHTRCPGAPDDWIESTDIAANAKRPVIREIWIGSRSMASAGHDDTPEGFACSQEQQEEAAELTELQTVLYQDQERYAEYVREHVEELVASAYELSNRTLTAEQLEKARDIARVQVMTETKNMGFIEDPETGEYRPIRNGDIIQIAWGSNENLDNLYLEEASDPRSEEGSLYRELLRDQIRANTDYEQDLLNDPTITRGSQNDEYADNDLHLRRVAYYKAGKIIERETQKHGKEPGASWQASVREESLRRVHSGHSALKLVNPLDAPTEEVWFSNNTWKTGILKGHWETAKDFFDEQEFNIRRLEECIRHNKAKRRPGAAGWTTEGLQQRSPVEHGPYRLDENKTMGELAKKTEANPTNWNVLRSVGTRLNRSKTNSLLAKQARAADQEQAERKARLIKARPKLASVLGS